MSEPAKEIDDAELMLRTGNGDTAALEHPEYDHKRILVVDHQLPTPDRDSGSLRP